MAWGRDPSFFNWRRRRKRRRRVFSVQIGFRKIFYETLNKTGEKKEREREREREKERERGILE